MPRPASPLPLLRNRCCARPRSLLLLCSSLLCSSCRRFSHPWRTPPLTPHRINPTQPAPASQASLLLSNPSGDFALVAPGTLVPAKDLSCEWVLAPAAGGCRVEMTITAMSVVPNEFGSLEITDADTGAMLFRVAAMDGSGAGTVVSSSGAGGLVFRYRLHNAASSQIFYGGFLASYRSACPDLPADIALLSALYGENSPETSRLLRQSALGGSVVLVLDNVTATDNAARGKGGSGGAVDLQLPHSAVSQARAGLLVVNGGTMARAFCAHPPTHPPTLHQICGSAFAATSALILPCCWSFSGALSLHLSSAADHTLRPQFLVPAPLFPQARNRASRSGGAINTLGSIRLDIRGGTLFADNAAADGHGGAVCIAANDAGNSPGNSAYSTPDSLLLSPGVNAATVRDANFTSCAVGGGGAGGAVAALGAAVAINGTSFTACGAGDGGAIAAIGSRVSVSASQFDRNSALGAATGGGGGGSGSSTGGGSSSGSAAPTPAAAAAAVGLQGAGGAAVAASFTSAPLFAAAAASLAAAGGAAGSAAASGDDDATTTHDVDNSGIWFSGCAFRRNAAASSGGAAAAVGNVTVSVLSSALEGSTAGGGGGAAPAAASSATGGAAAAGATVPPAPPAAAAAAAAFGLGGSLYVGPGAAATVSRCSVSDSSAARNGGAAAVLGPASSLAVSTTTVTTAAAPSGGGGAFSLSGAAALRVSATNVTACSAALGGFAAFSALPPAPPPAATEAGGGGGGARAWDAQFTQLQISGSRAAAGGLFAVLDSATEVRARHHV